MAKLAVIADDLTGANDTAVQFAKHGISSVVCIDFTQETLDNAVADVIVIDTDSRDITADLAKEKVKHVCKMLEKNSIDKIYKKVDSTLRGNLGAEIEAAAAVIQPDIVIIAPAFPKNKRITIDGCHLLEGMPIELTEIANSPKSPVAESQIVKLLQRQTQQPIGNILLEDVQKGTDTVRQLINSYVVKGVKWLVFDAVEECNLQDIVTAAQEYKKVLWVGSAGLAEYIPQLYDWSASKQTRMAGIDAPVLLVAGSISKTTQQQIAETVRVFNVQIVKLNVAGLLRDSAVEVLRCVKLVALWLSRGQDVMLVSAEDDRDVKQALLVGREFNMTSSEVSESVATAMGEVLQGVTGAHLSGLVLTGGDTAIHVCRAVQANAIEIVAEVAVGIPLGKLVGGRLGGMPVVTKAGAFGESDAFVKAIKTMRNLVMNTAKEGIS